MPNSQRLPPSTAAPPPETLATKAVLHDPAALALEQSERDLQRERGMLRRLIDIQEKERQLVSYEIHDGLAQYIAGAIMHLEAHLHDLEGREPRDLMEGMRLLRAAAEESRRLIGGLRPPALDELGIVAAIESLPLGQESQDSQVFLVVEGHVTDRAIVLAFERLRKLVRSLRVVGGYATAV
jgi:signal transduction histidine kinase